MEFPYTELRREHTHIMEQLSGALRFVKDKNTIQAIEAFAALEASCLAHFEKEDLNLYSRVFGDQRLQQGGPFCTFYFGSFMENRPLKILERWARKKHPDFQAPEPFSYQRKYFETGSLLTVPCEDHMAIVGLIQEIAKYLRTEPSLDWRWINQGVDLLVDVLKSNHEKEEHCLFPHVAQLLPV